MATPLHQRTQKVRTQAWIGDRQQGRPVRPVSVRADADSTASGAVATEQEDEIIEIVLDKPLGLRFTRGNDGGAYVAKNDPKLGSTDSRLEIGDKILEVSASFGDDVWEAKNFGQVMFAIRTRNGGVYLKIQRMFGDLSALQEEETTEAEKMWRREQAGGNVGLGTREIQERNYLERKDLEKQRSKVFNDALGKFRSGSVEDALIDFENVISLEPKKFMSDKFSRVSDVCMYAHYNAACCYSSLGNVDAALESLNSALAAGFDDYQKVRDDPNLAEARKSEDFAAVVNKYDESIINENAMRVLKGLFSFGKKDDDE